MAMSSVDDDAIRELAILHGISPEWHDHTGALRHVATDVLRRLLAANGVHCASRSDVEASRRAVLRRRDGFDLPAMLTMTAGNRLRIARDSGLSGRAELVFEDGEREPFLFTQSGDGHVLGPLIGKTGYHALECGGRVIAVAVAPARSITLPDIVGDRQLWGIAAQIYALRTCADGGIGHAGGVRELAMAAAASGCNALALSPAHALFHADPDHFSPYSPSSRLFLNTLYGDLHAVFEPARVAGAVARAGIGDQMARLEELRLVDWPAATRTKQALFRALFEGFLATEMQGKGDNALARAFKAFCVRGGDALRKHSIFESLHAHYFAQDFTRWHWNTWSPEHRDSDSSGVTAFAGQHDRELLYHAFLQWIAERSMADAQQAAIDCGMRIGLIADMAVGMNSGGSHAWSAPSDILGGLDIGAPPDPLAPKGQTWGLTTFSPAALAANAYAPFIDTLRAVMRHAGGVRIDHIMSLQRLWVVPEGEDATQGAYMAWPLDDLLRLVALESHRHGTVVIGEDLGTVPYGFRERMQQAGIYGMRVMQFERDGDRFYPPGWYPPHSVAMSSTHDLPPVAGWWSGADLKLRDDLDQFGPGQTHEGEAVERAADRARLWDAFVEAGAGAGSSPAADEPERAVDAATGFMARTRSQLAIIPLEDIAGLEEGPNLPGTTDESPNWRRRLGPSAARLLESPAARARCVTLQTLRFREAPAEAEEIRDRSRSRS